MGTGTIIAVDPNVNATGKVKVKLDDPSKAGKDGEQTDTFTINTTMLRHLTENATGGGTGASSVAVVTSSLGEKGSFSQKDVNKKLGGYSNMLSRGGKVTLPKAKK